MKKLLSVLGVLGVVGMAYAANPSFLSFDTNVFDWTNGKSITIKPSLLSPVASKQMGSANLTNLSGLATNQIYTVNNPAGYFPSNALNQLTNWLKTSTNTFYPSNNPAGFAPSNALGAAAYLGQHLTNWSLLSTNTLTNYVRSGATNVQLYGPVNSTNGFTTWLSNGFAPTTITLEADGTPTVWTNTNSFTVAVYVSDGGSVSAIGKYGKLNATGLKLASTGPLQVRLGSGQSVGVTNTMQPSAISWEPQ